MGQIHILQSTTEARGLASI